jgi:hypothetical protein
MSRIRRASGVGTREIAGNDLQIFLAAPIGHSAMLNEAVLHLSWGLVTSMQGEGLFRSWCDWTMAGDIGPASARTRSDTRLAPVLGMTFSSHLANMGMWGERMAKAMRT